MMPEVCPVICQLDPCARMLYSIKLALMNMHHCMRKIWNAAGVVKVQMRHHNVLDIRGRISKAGYLTNSSLFRIIVYAKIQDKKSDHQGWTGIVMEAQSCINKNWSFVCFHKQTGPTDVPAWKPRGHRRTIKDANCHGSIV